MSITMYTGRPGTGKTYSLVHDIIILLNKGHIVYSNFYIDWNGYDEKKNYWRKFLYLIKIKKELKYFPKENLKSWSKLEDLTKIKNGIIVMDEAHFYFNSRKWKELPFEFMRKLAQHRKDGIHILGSVQNIRRIDVVVRELIDYWYDCRKLFFLIIRTEFDIDEDQMKKRPLKTNILFFTKKRAKRYDTLEKIG